MKPDILCDHAFVMELLRGADGTGAPVHREEVTASLGELVDEAYVRGVLSDRVPDDAAILSVAIQPVYRTEPVVEKVSVTLTLDAPPGPVASGEGVVAPAEAADGATAVQVADSADGTHLVYTQEFTAGPWSRSAVARAHQLRAEGTLEADETALSVVLARRDASRAVPRIPLLQPPTVVEQSLEEFGVRDLGEGELVPDRPVLVNERMLEDILRFTEEAGASETGGGVLGKMLRLPEPLPGTDTRIVTLLTTAVPDSRHVGVPTAFTFSPEALADADEIARLRGFDEAVLTAFHTHGWGTSCGDCNQKAGCALPQCTEVSLDDYQVLEALLPSKATLMPIAGRKLGAPGRRPVLEIHAWRGGRMRPLRWRTYRD